MQCSTENTPFISLPPNSIKHHFYIYWLSSHFPSPSNRPFSLPPTKHTAKAQFSFVKRKAQQQQPPDCKTKEIFLSFLIHQEIWSNCFSESLVFALLDFSYCNQSFATGHFHRKDTKTLEKRRAIIGCTIVSFLLETICMCNTH